MPGFQQYRVFHQHVAEGAYGLAAREGLLQGGKGVGMDHFAEEFLHQRQLIALAERLHQQETLRFVAQQGFEFGVGDFFGDQQHLAA
ncbi:hypothetical protein D3C77_732520 [compost metagenome]